MTLSADDLAALARLRAFGEDPNNWGDSPSIGEMPPMKPENEATLADWYITFAWSMFPAARGQGARIVIRHMSVLRRADESVEPEMSIVEEIGAALGFGEKANCTMTHLPEGRGVCATVIEDTGARRVGKEAEAQGIALARAINEKLASGKMTIDEALASLGVSADGGPARAPTPPGRNDRCPCGSGKKYKKCHGGPDAANG